MARFLGVCAVVAMVAVALAAGSAATAWGDDEPAGIRVIDVEVSDDGAVSMLVGVPGLRAAEVDPATAFEIREDGEPRAVDTVAVETHDLEIAVVVDTSVPEQQLRELQSIAMELALRLPRDTPMVLVSTGASSRVVQPATTDVLERAAAAGRLERDGERAVYDALVLAVDELSTRPDARRSVVMLGASRNLASSATRDDVLEQLELANATLSVVHPDADRTGSRALDDLATATGGRVVSLDDHADLFKAVAVILADLLHQYRLTFERRGRGVATVNIRVDTESLSAETTIDLPRPGPPAKASTDGLRPGTGATEDPSGDEGREDTELLGARPGASPQATPGEQWLLLSAALAAVILLAVGAALWDARRPAGRTGSTGRVLVEHPHLRSRPTDRAAPTSAATPAPEVAPGPPRRPVLRRQRDRVASAGRSAASGTSAAVSAGAGAAATTATGVARALEGVWAALVRASAALANRCVGLVRAVAAPVSPLVALPRSTVRLLSRESGVVRRGAVLAAAEAAAVARTVARPLRDVRTAWKAVQRGVSARDRAPSRPPPGWTDVAAQIHREVGAERTLLDEAAEGIERRRNWTAAALRAAGFEGRLAAIMLSSMPVAVGVCRYLVDPTYLERLAASGLGWLSLAASTALTLAGALWLRRIAKPPFAARPSRWRAHQERADDEERLADALDRAWLYTVAGLDLEPALRRALSDDDHLAQLVREVLRSGPATDPADVDDIVAPEQIPGWVGVALHRPKGASAAGVLVAIRARLHADRVREAQAQAQRLPVVTTVPFFVCILPATLLVGLVAWS